MNCRPELYKSVSVAGKDNVLQTIEEGSARQPTLRRIVDATAYDRGRAEGKRQNPDYQEGYLATYPPAWDRGRRDGISAGYSDGWNDGYSSGYDVGYATVYDGCYSGAYSSSYDSAYDRGW